MDINEVWKKAMDEIENEVSAVSFDLWFRGLAPIAFRDGIFYLSSASESAKQRIMKMHEGVVKVSLQDQSGEIKDFRVLSPAERDEFMEEEQKTRLEENIQATTINFNPKYTFDNFVVGNCNKYAYAACKGVAENPFVKINPLFIYGGVGLGKTHLLHAIGNELVRNIKGLKILYIPCERFINDYVTSLKSKNFTNAMFREKYRNLDVLIIDDIQRISKAKETQEEFFNTFNELYQNNKQIIIASDRPPKDIATLEERLRSRFSMGIIQDIQPPEYETRLAILQKKADLDEVKVEDEVLKYIAENCDTNIREMEGILSKVCFYASLLGREKACMADCSEALKDQNLSNKRNLTGDKIIDCVCKYYNVIRPDIVGKKKNKEIVEPRQICMYLMYDMLNIPLNSIGQYFGGKDHTTVIYACRKVENMIKENNRIKMTVEDIKNMAKNLVD